jgi:hypothetical protein
VTRDVCLLARMMAANLYVTEIEDLMFEVLFVFHNWINVKTLCFGYLNFNSISSDLIFKCSSLCGAATMTFALALTNCSVSQGKLQSIT